MGTIYQNGEMNINLAGASPNPVMILCLGLIFLVLIIIGRVKPDSKIGKIFGRRRVPSLIDYCTLGWLVCFCAGVFLFKHMFGSWTEPDSVEGFAFYGFISLVPGVIIGALVYLAKKNDYDKKRQNEEIITFPRKDKTEDIVNKQTKECPYCGEEILSIAKKCKHCGEWLDNKE